MRKLQILLLLFITACHPVRKAVRVLDEHPLDAARYCANKFTARHDTTTVEVTIPGETEVRYVRDTVTADCPDGTPVRVPCPPAKHTRQVDTVYKTRTVWQYNPAGVAYEKGRADSLAQATAKANDRYERKAKAANRYGIAAFAGWGLFLLTLAIVYFANKRRS